MFTKVSITALLGILFVAALFWILAFAIFRAVDTCLRTGMVQKKSRKIWRKEHPAIFFLHMACRILLLLSFVFFGITVLLGFLERMYS